MSGELPTSFFEKSRKAGSRVQGQVSKIVRRDPLLFVFLAGVSGIVGAEREALFGFAFVVVGILVFTLHQGLRTWKVVAASLAGLIAFGSLHHRNLDQVFSFPFRKALFENDLSIVGNGWIADEPEFGAGSVSTLVRLESVEFRGHTLECDHLLPTWIQKNQKGLDYGKPIRFEGSLHPLEGRKAPGGFDASEFFFRSSGSLARLEIREGDELEVLEGNRGSRLIAFAQKSRRIMETALRHGLGEDDLRYAKLVSAMSLGIREKAPEDLQDLFRLSGTMHLFAVSGMHVAVVGGIFVWVALLIRIPRAWAVLIAIPLVLFYAVLTGLRPSSIRAAVMLSFFLLGYAFREKPRLLNILGLSGIVILVFDTQQLFLPGFQLSFLVVFFIAVFANWLRGLLSKPFLPDPFIPRNFLSPHRRWVDAGIGATAALLAVSIASWIGSAGLLNWHFRSLAPVGVIANVFMVPLAGMVISVAAFSLACSMANFLPIALLANKVSVGLAIVLTGMAQSFSGLPGAYLHTGDLGSMYEGEMLIVDVMGERGEGAVLMTLSEESGDRTSWMIDSGGEYSYRRQVLPTLRSRGVNRLDALVLTHGDSGHIGATVDLIKLLEPRVVIESTSENRSPSYPEILGETEESGSARVEVSSGQRIRFGEKIVGRVLAPTEEQEQRLADDRSLVLKIEYAERSLLFTSDAGFETEKALLEAGVDLEADVWIRGQHRQSPSGLPEFIEAVSPGTVVSSHADFPATESLSHELRERVAKTGANIFDTKTGGVVTIRITPDSIEVLPFASPRKEMSY